MKIHVCLLSDQILANLIPALMERPQKVVLVCTADMARKKLDRRLKKLLEKEGIAVDIHANAPDAGQALIQEFALDLAATLEATGQPIVLNATGGTKLMALGFVEVFRGIAQRILYTDTAHRCIETLPDGQVRASAPVPMTDVLDVARYLAAQGISSGRATSDDADWRSRAGERKAVAKYLGRNAERLGSCIGALNRLADLAFGQTDRLLAPQQSFDSRPRGPWADALHELAKAKLLEWTRGSADVIFIDAERTQFLRGGWLEEYAWHILADEKPFDVRLGLEVSPENGNETKNEYDVLATHANQLLFIECKTLRFKPGENDNELAYKLDSLGKAARGLFGETWLLSARAPTPMLKERLHAARIRLIGPDELPKLREFVQKWMQGDR